MPSVSFWCKCLLKFFTFSGQIVKKAGLIIKPITYEDMSVRERAEALKRTRNGHKQGKGKDKNRSTKKTTARV